MSTTLKLTKLSAALSLALLAPLSANAALMFDPDGTGSSGAYLIDQLDWAPSSMLSAGGNSAAAYYLNAGMNVPTAIVNGEVVYGNYDATDPNIYFNTYTMAKLGNLLLNGSTVSVASGIDLNAITLVAGFTERLTTGSSAGTANFDIITDATDSDLVASGYSDYTNFIEIWYDPDNDANILTGDGFANDGNAILVFRSTLSSLVDGVTATSQFKTTSSTPVALDQTSPDQWTGQQTVSGNGSADPLQALIPTKQCDDPTLGADEACYNNDFFNTLDLLQFVTTNISLTLPSLLQPAPSYAYYSEGGLSAPDLVIYEGDSSATQLGNVNGLLTYSNGTYTASGSDIILTTDINSVVDGRIPEPASLALFGLGLAGFAVRMRSRRRNG